MKTRIKLVSMALLAGSFLASCEKELTPKDLVPKTVDEDSSLPSIYISDTHLHSESYGNPDSAMIVVLHGGPGVDYRSLLNAKDLANEGYFVVFYDQRNTGLSRRHPKSSLHIQQTIDDLSAVIQHYKRSANQKVFLLGHSWGAMLATEYINTYPTQIAGVVLAEPGGFTWEQTKAYVQKSRQSNVLGETVNDATYTDQFINSDENDHELADYKLAILSASGYAPGNTQGNAGSYPFWRFGSAIFNKMNEDAAKDGFDFTQNLHQYTTPVLFVYSELNTSYGEQHAREVAAAYPNVHLEMVRGTGHEIVYFAWNNFRPMVLNYFNNLK
ncbi:MAG TPA: alpha/beta hydrolase [Bacteroidia bacterium]|nr:alpha/beta hydrolase [Bacteroidia bacterium]HNP98328.1 alpha/beta hydrolase [Bacteroidia bacterium]